MLDKISRMFLEHAHLVYEGRNTSPRDNIMTQLTLSLNRCKYGKTAIIDCYIQTAFPQDFLKISPRFPQVVTKKSPLSIIIDILKTPAFQKYSS